MRAVSHVPYSSFVVFGNYLLLEKSYELPKQILRELRWTITSGQA
jgi:hypothetical protein